MSQRRDARAGLATKELETATKLGADKRGDKLPSATAPMATGAGVQ